MTVNEDGVMVTGGNRFVSQSFFFVIVLYSTLPSLPFLTKTGPISIVRIKVIMEVYGSGTGRVATVSNRQKLLYNLVRRSLACFMFL